MTVDATAMAPDDDCIVCHLGVMRYAEALALQQAVHAARVEGRVPDALLLLEHPPTITRGRSADDAHLLAARELLASRGVEVHEVGRGGDFTVHEPGQLVGYPIVGLDTKGRDLHGYLRRVEEALIRALTAYGVVGERVPGRTGVFVGDDKIAAIGIQVRRWVTLHGFALNVTNDLSTFAHIVPCGIHDRGLTSLARLVSPAPSVAEFAEAASEAFGEVFGCRMARIEPEKLAEAIRGI